MIAVRTVKFVATQYALAPLLAIKLLNINDCEISLVKILRNQMLCEYIASDQEFQI